MTSPLYWFDVNKDQLKNITDSKWDCNLSIRFVDDDEDKTLDINVNGHMKSIDQQEPKFDYSLNDWVEEGRNYIKLIPKTTVDIVSLKIRLI